MSKIRENYPDRIQNGFIVFPLIDVPDNGMELLNTMFAMHQLIENCDNVQIFDNEALFDAIFKNKNIESPCMNDFNESIANTAADFTSILRYPRDNNTDFRGFITKLVCFPRLHFFTPSCQIDFKTDYNKFVRDLNNPKSLQLSMVLSDFKHISSIYVLRGGLRPRRFNQAVADLSKTSSLMNTVTFVPDHVDAIF